MKKFYLKILILLLIVLLVGVLTGVALGFLNPFVFWVLVILAGIFAFKILPKMNS